MKVLLVYPEYPATFWSFKNALPFINKKVSLPTPGLLTVASLLPGEWKKKFVDMNAEDLKDGDIKQANYVFISGMVVQRNSAKEVIKRAKQLFRTVFRKPDLISEAVTYPDYGYNYRMVLFNNSKSEK